MAARRESRPRELRLALEGMTCAGCVAAIEGALNGVEGISATVNLATGQAAVRCEEPVPVSELVAAVEAIGYGARPAGAPADVRAAPATARPAGPPPRLVLAVCLSLPVALIAMVPSLTFAGAGWVELALSTPVVLYAGLGFHRSALRSARHRAATMDTLVSLGTLTAYLWSAAVVAGALRLDTYFEVAASVTTLVLLGRYLEARARGRASEAIRELARLGAKEAVLLGEHGETPIAADELRVGDVFVVRPGEQVATDGVVVEGASEVDCSLLTGEPVPVQVAAGSEVTGATLNGNGRLIVRATRVGADTALARIARLVEAAQSGKAPVQRLADRVSAVFCPVVIGLALATFAGWLAAGAGAGPALTAAVSVLVIACPCALGLATPVALMVGSGRGAQLGVLIKGPEVLERTRSIDTIVLDKTGTVTEGRVTLAGVALRGGAARREVLRLAGAVEAASEHPVGRAVAAAARAEVGALPRVAGFRSRPGVGVSGLVDGHQVAVGRAGGELEVGWDGRPRATLLVADVVKPTSAQAVSELRALGLEPVLLTGDAAAAADAVAAEVGIARTLAGVLPAGKAREIERLRRAGAVVAMVGDGVNDAPALAEADLGLALGTGSDIAIETADITLVSGDLRAAVDAIRLARRTLRTIKENLFWAFAYNVAALPLAAAGLVNPIVAAAAMAGSSLFVVGNSLRLRRFRSVRELPG